MFSQNTCISEKLKDLKAKLDRLCLVKILVLVRNWKDLKAKLDRSCLVKILVLVRN